MKKTVSLLISQLLIFANVNSQSSSVFEASYFSKKEIDPPIETGKGFHINDVYKQTRHCFTPETSDESKLKARGGKKISVSVHYTMTDEDYNKFKSQGVSGKVSYLNLFSIEGSKQQSFSSEDYGRQERLVFVAKTDFGTFSYPMEPTLLPESKSLIDQGKHDEFIQLYGTHYISGVRREASIWVVLTKKDDSYQSATSDENSVGGGFETPFKLGVNYKIDESEKNSWLKNSSNYELTVEINGPSMDHGTLKRSIANTLDSKEGQDKISIIKSLMTDALSNITDPNQSVISQYYFAPFTLYGVNNINWDLQKEENLIKINESVIDVLSTQSVLEKLLAPTALKDVEADFDGDLSTFSKKNQYKVKLEKTYTAMQPNLKNYKKQLDTTMISLQKIYMKCSDIHCGAEAGCCTFNEMENRIKTLTYKVDNEVSKITKIKDEAWTQAMSEVIADAMIPECEKEKTGYMTVINSSSNPYDFYQGDSFVQKLDGGSTTKFKVGIGTWNFKASQVSGYMMYPTVNNRRVTIGAICDEVTIKVGFED